MDFNEIEKDLDQYRKQMKTNNLLESAHKAKEKSMQLFEDQGIASIALVFSQIFVNILENPDKFIRKSYQEDISRHFGSNRLSLWKREGARKI